MVKRHARGEGPGAQLASAATVPAVAKYAVAEENLLRVVQLLKAQMGVRPAPTAG